MRWYCTVCTTPIFDFTNLGSIHDSDSIIELSSQQMVRFLGKGESMINNSIKRVIGIFRIRWFTTIREQVQIISYAISRKHYCWLDVSSMTQQVKVISRFNVFENPDPARTLIFNTTNRFDKIILQIIFYLQLFLWLFITSDEPWNTIFIEWMNTIFSTTTFLSSIPVFSSDIIATVYFLQLLFISLYFWPLLMILRPSY